MNHPSGRIGKRLMLRVADVMLTGKAVPRVTPEVQSRHCGPCSPRREHDFHGHGLLVLHDVLMGLALKSVMVIGGRQTHEVLISSMVCIYRTRLQV